MRIQHPAPFSRLLLILAVALSLPLLLADAHVQDRDSKQDLPAGEEELFKHANERYSNYNQWGAAERAYKRYLELYPEGKHVEQVLVNVGQILTNHGRYKDARTYYKQLVEKFPKSVHAPLAQYHIGYSYLNQNMRKQAEKEFRKLLKDYPESQYSHNAVQMIFQAANKNLYMYINQSYTEGEEISINTSIYNIEDLKLRLYRVAPEGIVEKIKASNQYQDIGTLIAASGAKTRSMVKEWSHPIRRDKNGYHNVPVTIDRLEAGFYILSAEPDAMDLTLSVNLIVAKYGVIVKSSRDQVLAFAVDRRSGRPVQDMAMTYSWPQGKVDSRTNADGLCTMEAKTPHQGIVFGIKDGEIALANTYFYGQEAEQKMYIYTDRPVYRPNQVVHFKVITRELKEDRLSFKPNDQWRVEIKDPKNNTLYKSDLISNEFGTLSGELLLGDEPALGFYHIYLSKPEQNAQNYYYYGHQGQFRVEEYRKPEYKVDVTFDGGPYSFEDAVSASINVNYYFGSPVVDADVQYTVYRELFYDYDWGWDDPWYWYYAEDSFLMGRRCCIVGPWYYRYSEPVTQGTGKTDRDGKLKITFTAKPFTQDYYRNMNARFVVQAKAVDKSRREVEGSGSAKVTRADFNLLMTLSKYVYKPGDTVDIKIKAVDIDGKAVKDVRVAFTAQTRNWSNSKYEDEGFFSAKASTDDAGVAQVSFLAQKEGYIRVVAEASDRKDRSVQVENTLWISGHNYYASFQNMTGLDIIPDKNTYEMNDTARLLITSQFKGVHALLTLEGDRIHHSEVIHIKGHSKLVELKLDKKEFSPNVTVTVTTLIKNQYLTQSKTLLIPPSAFVTAKITSDKPTYRPREEATYTVETLDQNGKPVSAEVSIGIVDDSIYAIQDELAQDIRKFYYSPRPNRVATNTSMHYYDYGRGDMAQKEADAVGGAKPAAPAEESRLKGGLFYARGERSNGGNAPTEIRSYFPDTMFWRAHVVTDGNGKAEFKVAVPDSLTAWRTTVRAVTGDTFVGSATQNVIARKNVIIRLETPRFFTQNDETVISAVVHNYLGNVREVKVELESEGIEVIGAKQLTLAIPQGEDRRVDWKVRIADAGTARLTAKALTPIESDAMKLEIPILAHGSPRYDVQAGVVENKFSTKIRVPDGAITRASELKVVVSPTIANTVVDSLDYLAGYPYGCVEQTMSRFLPTVVATQTMRKLGLRKPELESELPEMIAAGLQRLYNFQQGDGGWGWWQNDKSNPYTTAYVVFGLAQATLAGADVDPQVLQRGTQALKNLLQNTSDLNTQMYMTYALTMAKHTDVNALKRLARSMDELNDYSKGLLAYCLQVNGMASDAKAVMDQLEGSAKSSETFCYWESDHRGYGWMDHNIEATAYILKAMVAVNPKSPNVHKIVRWLASQRQGDHWSSTKDTAAIVYALSDYLAVSDELNADYRLTVKLNGKPIVNDRINKDNMFTFNGVKNFKWHEFNAGENEITIEKEGNGVAYYSVYLKTYTKEEGFQAGGSIQIERTYNHIAWDRNNQKILMPIEEGTPLKSGEEIEVVLRVTSDQNHQYILIEDPLPSGFEVVKDDQMYGRPGRGYYYEGWWNWWYSRKEARDNRVCIASTYVPKGTQEIHYMIRAETPGDYHVMPTRAYNMYHPEIGGTSAEDRVRVVDKK